MLLDNAVLIETHTDKGKGTPKENNKLIQTYVLVSALKSGNDITPIQFEIMEYKNNENRLYLAVAMTKINEADVVGNTGDNDVAQTNLLSTSNISIVNIFKKINPQDKNFLKYIPDEFLNAEQKKAKASALDIEAVKFVKDSKNISAEEKHNFFDTLKSVINHIVDVISKHVTNKGLCSSEKAVADMSLDDIKALRKQFISVIDGAISNLENGVEVRDETKNSLENFDEAYDYSKNIDVVAKMESVCNLQGTEFKKTRLI